MTQNKGYKLCSFKFQAILIRGKLASRLTTISIIDHVGRLIAHVFHTNKTTSMLLISIYGMVDDGSRDASNKIKKSSLRRRRFKTTCSPSSTNS